jgi:phosphonate transport system ATP-binding protein
MSLALAFDVERAPPIAEATRSAAPDIAVSNLSVRFGGGRPVFSGVSFSIMRGQAVALIGANGAGKSTILKCCLGLIEPAEGDVTLFDRPMTVLRTGKRRSLRRKVGFVAQKHNLVPRLSVLSNVVNGLLAQRPGPRCWLHGLASTQSRAAALAALDRVGLAHLALRRADTLSGGQSQRVAIARALVAEPRLIIADEPAASLDPAAGEEVMEAFDSVVRRSGTTLLFTTHHLEHAVAYADRVIGLREGTLQIDQPASSIAAKDLRGLYDAN